MRIPDFTQLSPQRLALLIGLAFALFLGAHPYITPSEARYIELPRQMVVSGDWVVPHINGVPYFEKPPLFYWMQAIVFSMAGWGEYAGRALTALLSVALCMLTYALGMLFYSRRVGAVAALALATSWLGFSLSRVVMLDVPVSVCITATLYCFLRAAREEKPPVWILYGMYIAAALGMLTKGLIAVALPGLIVLVWLAFTKNWRLLLRLRIPTGALLFLAIVLPWHIAAGNRYPEFWKFYFLHEHFDRFLTDAHHRDQPWWFFIAVLLVGIMPWLPVLARSLWQERENRDPYRVFLLLWAAIPLVFFSLSHSKLVPYIYPIFSPLCVLLAPPLLAGWERRDRLARACVYIAVLTPLLGYTAQMLAPYVWRGSVKPMAMALKEILQEGDEVAIYGNYRQDLPIYLNRNIIVGGYEGELAFGMSIEPETHQWMMSDAKFIANCQNHIFPIYIMVSDDNVERLKKQCAVSLVVDSLAPERFSLYKTQDSNHD